MAEEQAKVPQNQEELSEWVREQFQRATKHLAEHGVVFQSVKVEESRYLAPYFAIWKIRSTDNEDFWVIGGDVPADFSPVSIAKTAREAIRHFSFSWQMKAENLRRMPNVDASQQDFAALLEKKAEMMYQLFTDKSLWQDIGDN